MEKVDEVDEICSNFGESSIFFFFLEVISYVLDWVWSILLNIVLLPVGVCGLCLTKTRQLVKKVGHRSTL